MKNLDDNLRDALRREEPAEGFAERVLRRVEEQERNTGSRPGLMRPGFTGGSKGPALRSASAVADPTSAEPSSGGGGGRRFRGGRWPGFTTARRK